VAERIVRLLEDASGGRLEIDFFAGGAVVPAAEEASALRTGTLDFVYGANGYNQHLEPVFPLFDQMVGGLSDPQLAYWLEGGGGYELAEEGYAKYGIVYLANHLWSPEDFAYTDFPLETVDDIKKLKMRTAGIGGEVLTMMGASTVFLPGGELYESMQRGVINAFEYGGAAEMWEMGFHEVVDYMYLSLSRAPSDSSNWLVSDEAWSEVPDDLKLVIKYILRGAINTLWLEQLAKNGAAVEMISDYGVIVERLPVEIEDAVLAAAIEFFDGKIAEYGRDSYYARVVLSQRAYKALAESQSVF
jgi:TRAP-type mannitol/chloroaromatic compound transport system substrate-binding protein